MVGYRRPLLGFVLGAIVVTAVLGLYAVLVPDFGDLQAKVLGTSASISATSVVMLALAPALERRLVRPLPAIGAVLAVVTLCLILVGMWGEIERDGWWKAMGTAAMLTAWILLTCLLVLATLPRRYLWVFLAAAGLTLALTAIGIAAMWAEPDSEAMGRLVAALAVLSAAFVLTVPVLHRASRDELRASAGSHAEGYCPRCGAPVPRMSPGAPTTCTRCGARFRVEFDDNPAAREATTAT